jgi:AraC-like DNA-binding protein
MSVCLRSKSDLPAPTPAPFSHARHAPSSALAPFVDHYWVSRWDRRGVVAKDAASLLDVCVHLQIINGDAQLMGVQRGPMRMRIEGVGCVIGVKFRAGGFYPFVRDPVSRWTDRVVPMADVFAGQVLDVTQFDALLESRLPERDATAEEMSELVALIAKDAQIRRMSDLVARSGRGERTLHRLFMKYVGVSPAWTIRRYRLRAAAQRLAANPPEDVSTVASELGYADQAHFIRDFRATIGITPGEYLGHASRAGRAGFARG